ncbi:MAG: RagB/SusD family nutrient uptake outer membrane protein [Rufibacter sp.]
MANYKWIKLSCVSLLLSMVTACVSLEEDPKNFIAPSNFYKTEADALAAVTAAYRQMTDFSYHMVMHILTDNATDNSNEGRANLLAKAIDQFTTDSGNGQILNMWAAIYKAINAANAVTEYVPGITMNSTQRDQIVGEAKFLRAMSYYNLVRLFGGVPLHVTPTTSVNDAYLGRATVDEVYAQIIKDLEDAEAVLPTTYPATFRGRATKMAAQTLLASVHLTRQNWQKASDYAKAVMTAMPNGLFPNIETLWKLENKHAPEFIFSLQNLPNVGIPNTMAQRFKPRVVGGTGIGWVEMAFFNSFQPGDVRKDVSIWTSVKNKAGATIPWQNWSDPFPHIGKYRYGHVNDFDTGESATNTPVLRYAEVLLIYAEAQNELNGPTAEAYKAVNMVRRRAFKENIESATAQPHDLPTGLTKDQFRDAILQERAWEFDFEWKRWFDLVRTKKLIEVMKPSRPLIEEKHYLYPIPQAQIDVNPNMVQNPGY